MVDQQTDQVLDAQSVPVIDCTSIMETAIVKTTGHQLNNGTNKLQQDQINSQNKQAKDITKMLLKLSYTLS